MAKSLPLTSKTLEPLSADRWLTGPQKHIVWALAEVGDDARAEARAEAGGLWLRLGKGQGLRLGMGLVMVLEARDGGWI